VGNLDLTSGLRFEGATRSTRVFLAYASVDKSAARDLYQRLKADGFLPWFDEANLLAGQLWELEIERSIHSSDFVVALLSKNSVGRAGYVNREIRMALDRADQMPRDQTFVIPVRIDKTKLPDNLRHVQFVDLYSDAGYRHLVAALGRSSALDNLRDEPRDFEYTGLIDANGWPLERTAPERGHLILDVREVNAHLIHELKRSPERIYELSADRFEELVAELLSRQGYSITRTPFSRDGGFDMYAARKDGLGEFLYLVECKRYTPPNKVGVNVVRSLRGVLSEKRATAAAVVTTSYFTAGAKAFRSEFEHQLALHDYIALQSWLQVRAKPDTA
jgi:hypothetical protein